MSLSKHKVLHCADYMIEVLQKHGCSQSCKGCNDQSIAPRTELGASCECQGTDECVTGDGMPSSWLLRAVKSWFLCTLRLSLMAFSCTQNH